MKTHGLTLILSAALLSSCASTARELDGDTSGVGNAAMTPVEDVGLSKIRIPAYLAEMRDPYATTPVDCPTINAEVDTLNGLLGEDLDIPEEEAERRERLALNATSSAVGGLIPFRGVVRAISGAASNERNAREAYQRGLVRRAYLKGVATRLDCDTPSVADAPT